jgi:hypothetical protein
VDLELTEWVDRVFGQADPTDCKRGAQSDMPVLDWRQVLSKYFDKPIQETGNHAYPLVRPIAIRADAKDILLPQGSIFIFEQERQLAVVRESADRPEKYHIELKSISLVIAE